MGWCNVGPDDGEKAVADLLMFNSTIKTLDLRGNALGDAGVHFQCRAMHPCCLGPPCRDDAHQLFDPPLQNGH